MNSLKIAHISDLHFSKWNFSPYQFLSKRWLGNFNALFHRLPFLSHERLNFLPQLFKHHQIQHVLITGDLSTTSSDGEFKQALDFIHQFQKEGIEVFCVPGNHDQYTKKAYQKKLFYSYFPSKWSQEISYDLKEHGLTGRRLSSHWWLLGIDTAVATSLLSSEGYFSPKTEHYLKEFLEDLTSQDKIILLNHYPTYSEGPKHKQLIRASYLKHIIESYPQIKIFCHGHTHRHTISAAPLPIILDSGCTSHRYKGYCNLLTLSSEQLKTEIFTWKENQWEQTHEKFFSLV